MLTFLVKACPTNRRVARGLKWIQTLHKVIAQLPDIVTRAGELAPHSALGPQGNTANVA